MLAVEYYLALAKKIMSCAMIMINLKDIMPSEINQEQKRQILCGATYMKFS